MKNILENLRAQHQFILQLLETPERLLELLRFVEDVHHPLEEEALFPWVAQAPWLRQGGPRCSYHMGMRLERDPLGRMRTHLAAFYQTTGWAPEPVTNPAWLTPQSPLSIPMEEHAVSHELSASLKHLLQNSESVAFKDYFKILYEDYAELLRMHIDKEDNCLFVMCEARAFEKR